MAIRYQAHRRDAPLAKDYREYQNLCRLVTDAHIDGYYHKPRIDHEHLAKWMISR